MAVARSPAPPTTGEGLRNTKEHRVSAVDVARLPTSFTRNALKEEVALEYCAHFDAQFRQLYPDRRSLLLCPANEAGTRKFVCSSLRPALAPSRELYDAAGAARFVAAHIAYEPLNPPTAVPARLPSSLFTLQTRSGDSFDLALLLTSILLGAGYDAYVAIGTAPAWVTLKQQDKSLCPSAAWAPPADALDRAAHVTPQALGLIPSSMSSSGSGGSSNAPVNRYRIAPPVPIESEVQREAARRAEAEAAAATARAVEEGAVAGGKEPFVAPTMEEELAALREGRPLPIMRLKGSESSSRPGSRGGAVAVRASSARSVRPRSGSARATRSALAADPYSGQRVHAWVLVLEGRREVSAPFFLEPSTGESYLPSHAPYLEIDALFSHRNYWVNMQGEPPLPRQEATSALGADRVVSLGHAGAAAASALGNGLPTLGGGAPLGSAVAALQAAAAAAAAQGSSSAPAMPTFSAEAVTRAALRPELLAPYVSGVAAVREAQKVVAGGFHDARMEAIDKRIAQAEGGDTGAEEEDDEEEVATPIIPASSVPGAPRLMGPGPLFELAHPRTTLSPLALSGKGNSSGTWPSPAPTGGAGSMKPDSDAMSPSPDGLASNANSPRSRRNSSAKEGAGEGTDGGSSPKETASSPHPTDGGRASPNEADQISPTSPGAIVLPPLPESAQGMRPGNRAGARGAGMAGAAGAAAGTAGMPSWRHLLAAPEVAPPSQTAVAVFVAAQVYLPPPLAMLRWDLNNADDWENVLLRKGGGGEEEEGGGRDEEEGLMGLGGDDHGFGGVGSGSSIGLGRNSSTSILDGEGEEEEEEGDDRSGSSGAGGLAVGVEGGHSVGGHSRSAAAGKRRVGSASAATAAAAAAAAKAAADLPLEHAGEHLLTVPPPWCNRIVLDARAVAEVLAPLHCSCVEYHRSRLERFTPHTHEDGLVARHVLYADTARLIPSTVTEVFSARKDGLFKRVRHCGGDGRGMGIEEHFSPGRMSGLAITFDAMGSGCHEAYFYHGARRDGLLLRSQSEDGAKIREWFGSTAPSRVWYRAARLIPDVMTPSGSSPLITQTVKPKADATVSSSRSVASSVASDVSSLVASGSLTLPELLSMGTLRERVVMKLTEKFRRDAVATPLADEDPAVVAYSPAARTITITYHAQAGRLARTQARYDRATGALSIVSAPMVGGNARPIPTAHAADVAYIRLLEAEGACHRALRASTKAMSELLAARAWENGHVTLELTIFDAALARVAAGVSINTSAERPLDIPDRKPDYLLPYLIAAKATDRSNPSEKEARRADKECRAAFAARLRARVGMLQRKLDAENEALVRRQQAHARSRDHSAAAEAEAAAGTEAITFRIALLEQRITSTESAIPAKVAALNVTLREDPRLAILYDLPTYRKRMEALGDD